MTWPHEVAARSIALRIEELVLDVPGTPEHFEAVGRHLLEEAFTLLALKLERTPWTAGLVGIRELRLDQVSLDSPAPDALLGSGGPEALAEALYLRILRGLE